MTSKVNFVRQQGLRDATSTSCVHQYPALMWQPRIIGVLVLLGLVLQSRLYFLALGTLLWWNALWPAFNPFDAFYNLLLAEPKGLPRLAPAPAPRRFAQGMAGTFMLGIGVLLANGWNSAARGLEGILVLALAALILGRFCMGSYVFLLITRQAGFAHRTLPWTRTGQP